MDNEENKCWQGSERIYQTVVIDYSPKADKMAQAIVKKANEMHDKGFILVTMSITNSAKAILVFKQSE
ncbi:hypothetical protein CBF29_10775 [Vagococcus elongatus]|uniref:Uncharacterized protein n=1 Tax=Vagococcus elongatus TaxID=180344 RepID=A0A430AP58_9ENTE|nr:hypothetical protein CBF29_10775 [Vagococcus elongatus]